MHEIFKILSHAKLKLKQKLKEISPRRHIVNWNNEMGVCPYHQNPVHLVIVV